MYRRELEAAQPEKVQELREAKQRRRLKKAEQGDEDQGQLDFEEDGVDEE